MARKPQKPQKGQPAIKELYNSVCDIIDYLPSLEVTGDQKSTYVTKSSAGTVIHAAQPNLAVARKGQEYTSGRFIRITSGNAINCILTGGTDIEITPAGVINYTGSGGGPGSDTTYTGQYNVYSSGWISVDSSGSNPHLISSNLRWIEQLYNYPLVASSNIVMPNSLTACNNTVDISQVGTIYSNHFIQTRDILYDGLGTKVSLAWTRNPFGDVSPEGTNGIIEGLQVDLTLSGGRFADVVLHKHVFGAYDPNTGTRYDPPTESRVDCLLTGTYDHYPHTSGFIDVVPVEMEDGKTWGVISTNLHAGSGIAIDPSTGEITATGGGGGTTVIFKAPDYAKLQVQNDAGESAIGLGTTYLVPVENGSAVRYEADGGTIVAVWAPVKGSSENAHAVTTTNWSTTDDGYVRISVIDDGTLSAGCLRLYVDNKDVPLHKFARFNYSSGAIYEGGRYTTIQTTSTRINAETELEEEYTLEKPIINNMLTGGRFVTIQEEENNVALEYPRINCTLQAGTGIDINEQSGIISCTVTAPSTVYDLLQEGPNIKLTKLSNGKTQISGTAAGSGGGGGGGGNSAWPMWENLCGSGHLVYTEQWYTTSTGGWLRLSNRGGGSYHGCNSIYIDPVVPAAGVEGQNHIGLGNAMVSFFLPVPPGSSFWIGMPDDAQCWFDGSTSPATHTSTDHAAMNEIKNEADSAKNVFNSASGQFIEASNYFDSASSYWNSYYPDNLDESDKDDFYDWWDYISGNADNLKSYAADLEWYYNDISEKYEQMTTDEGLKYVTSAETFYLSASNWATIATNYAISAKYYYDNCPT